MLTSLGTRVEVCLCFSDAQRRLQPGEFDLLLTDLNLDRGHTGIELLRELRRLPHGPDAGAGPDDRARPGYYETHVQPLLRLQGQVKEISCGLRRPGRDPVPVLLYGAEVRDEVGQVQSMRFAFSEVTDRRRFEFELRRARQHAEHFKAIDDASADAILSLSAAGLVQRWNAAAERLFGPAASWALGRHVSELIVVDDPAASVALALVKLREGQAVHRETVCTRPDGQRLTVSIWLSPPVLAPPQALVGVSVIVRDMTEQARARACLRDSEEQFRTLFDLSPAGVVLIDPVAGSILECNEEAARSCGYARHEFVGRPVRDVVAPAYRLQSTARRDRILATGGDAFETQHISRSGDLRDVHARVRAITIRGEVRLLAVWEDVTVSGRSQAALRASQERLAFGVQVAGLALADVNYQTGMTALSTEAARLFGLGEQAMSVPRHRMHDTFHPEDRPEVLRRIQGSLVPGSSGWFAMELRVRWPTGQQRWLRLPLHFSAALQDISAKRAALAALQQQRQFVERLTEVVPSILYVFDIVARRHVWVNRRAGACAAPPAGADPQCSQGVAAQGPAGPAAGQVPQHH